MPLRRPQDAPPNPPPKASATEDPTPGPYNDVAASVSSERHQQAQTDAAGLIDTTAQWVNAAAGYMGGRPAQVARAVNDIVNTITPTTDGATGNVHRTERGISPLTGTRVKGISTTTDDSPAPSDVQLLARQVRNGGVPSSKK